MTASIALWNRSRSPYEGLGDTFSSVVASFTGSDVETLLEALDCFDATAEDGWDCALLIDGKVICKKLGKEGADPWAA